MAKSIKAPKYAKSPKAPKQGASLAVLERYEKRCKDVAKTNTEKRKAYEAALSKREQEAKKKASIRNNAKRTLEKAKGK